MEPAVSVGPYPDRIIRVGVAESGVLLPEWRFEPGSDVVLGDESSPGLVVRGWQGPHLLLIERGTLLRLRSGMRLVMCDEAGQNRVAGTYDELTAKGMTFPLSIPVSRLNINVHEEISVFLEFVSTTPKS